MRSQVTVVVVTHNRKALLRRCLVALTTQTTAPARIVVVDNASDDGTRRMLIEDGWLSRNDLELLSLSENTGGAGGFAAGMQAVAERGDPWVWVMDDDACPYEDALERIHAAAADLDCIYGSVTIQNDRLAWPMKAYGADRDAVISDPSLLPARLEVEFVPFLGMLVSREMIAKIGVPDPGFFIAKDDVEYCFRARQSGGRIELVAASRIEHPAAQHYELKLPGITFKTLRLNGWKRYYSTRNRLQIARLYFGTSLYFATLPASLVHLLLALIHESDRIDQLRAFVGGTIDGLRGRMGRRHEIWGLSAKR